MLDYLLFVFVVIPLTFSGVYAAIYVMLFASGYLPEEKLRWLRIKRVTLRHLYAILRELKEL